jgi:hypothetical protein
MSVANYPCALCLTGEDGVRPVTLRRHLSVALPLSKPNYGSTTGGFQTCVA